MSVCIERQPLFKLRYVDNDITDSYVYFVEDTFAYEYRPFLQQIETKTKDTESGELTKVLTIHYRRYGRQFSCVSYFGSNNFGGGF